MTQIIDEQRRAFVSPVNIAAVSYSRVTELMCLGIWELVSGVLPIPVISAHYINP